jgi:hypothetical protein
MLLCQAAAIPNPGLEKDSQQIAAAHFVLHSAQDESASWANQEDSARAVQRRTAKNPGDHSADA